ncbi:MAG: hypothetical protein JW920_04365 [Deltaproteobacteria bacterium]|nr:hypothetical protein [Deltaproteobacteria bacterium]
MLAPGGPDINPGESQQITIQIATISRKGSFRKDIYLTTNDPDAATAKLSIQADVQEVIVIEPRYINFGMIKAGATHHKAIQVINKGNDPLTITHISANPEQIVQLVPQEEFILAPKEHREILLTLTPVESKKNIYGNLIISTDLEYLPQKSIRFRAQVIPESKETSQNTE